MPLLLLLALFMARAAEPAPRPVAPPGPPDALEDLLADLSGSKAMDRLYAARTLRSQVRRALRMSRRSRDEVFVMEALQDLADFDRALAPRCMELLSVRNVARPCADILGMLGQPSSRDALIRALDLEPRRRTRRHLRRALVRIEAAGQ